MVWPSFKSHSCKAFFNEEPFGWGWHTVTGAKYCPYCGTRWEGQQKRKLKRWEDPNDPYLDEIGTSTQALYHFLYKNNKNTSEKIPDWIIQTCVDWGYPEEDRVPNYWYTDHILPGSTSAVEVMKLGAQTLRESSKTGLWDDKPTILRYRRGEWVSKEYVLDGDEINKMR